MDFVRMKPVLPFASLICAIMPDRTFHRMICQPKPLDRHSAQHDDCRRRVEEMLPVWNAHQKPLRRWILWYHPTMQTYEWYQQLITPSWAPPSWIFGPVWTVLYIGILISFGAVFVMAAQKKIDGVTAVPFMLNLLFNFSFTPIQFGLQNNYLAAIDILLVLGTLIYAMRSIFRHAPWIAYAQIPYLLWVTFATCLQLTITYLNFR